MFVFNACDQSETPGPKRNAWEYKYNGDYVWNPNYDWRHFIILPTLFEIFMSEYYLIGDVMIMKIYSDKYNLLNIQLKFRFIFWNINIDFQDSSLPSVFGVFLLKLYRCNLEVDSKWNKIWKIIYGRINQRKMMIVYKW